MEQFIQDIYLNGLLKMDQRNILLNLETNYLEAKRLIESKVMGSQKLLIRSCTYFRISNEWLKIQKKSNVQIVKEVQKLDLGINYTYTGFKEMPKILNQLD